MIQNLILIILAVATRFFFISFILVWIALPHFSAFSNVLNKSDWLNDHKLKSKMQQNFIDEGRDLCMILHSHSMIILNHKYSFDDYSF